MQSEFRATAARRSGDLVITCRVIEYLPNGNLRSSERW
jgi:hypothetical protein